MHLELFFIVLGILPKSVFLGKHFLDALITRWHTIKHLCIFAYEYMRIRRYKTHYTLHN